MTNVVLSLVVLKTRQSDALQEFYGSIGIKLAEERHGRGPLHFAGQIGDVVFEIYPFPEDGAPVDATTRLGFVVSGLAEVVGTLRNQNVPIDIEPRATQWGLRAVVRDPDGRAVELYEREPP